MSKIDETQLQYFMACSKKGDVDGLATTKLNANVTDELGNTGVHWASSAGYLDAVKYLVEKRKAKINTVNNNGDTPLHLAAWRGEFAVVQYLVDHEAELEGKNKEGKRPVDLAHHLEIKAYLESFEGDDEEDKGENASDEE
eukprot:gene975-9882_t